MKNPFRRRNQRTAGFGVTDTPDDWFAAFVDPTIDPDGGIFHWAQSFLDLMSYGPEYDRGVNDLVTDARDAFQKGDLESTRRFLQQAGDRVMAKAGKPREPYNPNFASKKTAADISDPMDVGVIDGAPDQSAPVEPPRLYHCPVCGSGSITRGSDGTTSCGFCSNAFKIILAPQHPAMPMTIDGEPFTPDGQPPVTGAPMDLGNPTPTPGVAAPAADPDAAPGTLQSFRTDGPPDAGDGTLQSFRTSMFVTASGDALPFDSFLAHLAVRNANDPAGVIEQIRAKNAAIKGTPMEPGTVVQYRKVGTFRIIGPGSNDVINEDGSGWYFVEAVKAPKGYREKTDLQMWVGPKDVVSGG